jgi:hypothetical protein
MQQSSGIAVKTTHVGQGVFATRSFRKSRAIGEMRGELLTDADHEFDPDYAVDMGDFGTLEPSAPFRFLNHSCEPNAELVMYVSEDEEPPTMWVEATRPIKTGEQITIDYAWPADDAIPCLCGAESCRGWVVARDDALRLPKPPPPKRSATRRAPRAPASPPRVPTPALCRP